MGLGSSKVHVPQPPPETLSEFKKLAITPEQYSIPEIPQKREVTDLPFLIVFIFSFLLLFGFTIYSLTQTDSLRFTNGYDNCGNVCGENNERYPDINCTGKDYRDAKFLLNDFGTKSCLKECDPKKYKIVGNKCFPRRLEGSDELDKALEDLQSELDRFQSIAAPTIITEDSTIDSIPKRTRRSEEDFAFDDMDQPVPQSIWRALEKSLGYTILALLISGMVSFGLLILFKYAVAGMVWGIIGTSYALLISTTLLIWIIDSFSAVTVVLIIICIIVTTVFMASVKRIPLVINLFKEAMKAMFALPGLIMVSILILLAVFACIFLFLVTLIEILEAGVLTPIGPNEYIYLINGPIIFTIILLVFMTIWICSFLSACQIMIISGAVSSWYFSRDKTFLGSPVKDSFRNLIKFHIGTAAFGSLIIAILHHIKFWLWLLSTNGKTRFLAVKIMSLFQVILVYICRNGYIVTAMHGESFIKSGKRAIQLIFANINDVMPLNMIVGFILWMVKLLVCISSYLLCIALLNSTNQTYVVGTSLGLLLGMVLGHYIFNTVGIIIDTIYLCYCEDIVINDGLERPYYMSVDLMQFFDESKRVLSDKE